MLLFYFLGYVMGGCVSDERYQRTIEIDNWLNNALQLLQDYKMARNVWRKKLNLGEPGNNSVTQR